MKPSDVVITGTVDTSSGLRVQFYVQGTRGGVIPKQAVAAAIQVTLTSMPAIHKSVITTITIVFGSAES